ncbi:hypothetical protein ACLRDC_19880 [Gluconacetobacter sacchari]|uniref:hypothetical protein n=1 Tax=Gluconacetobacter sacchari TaxID=92759 RepID=UPI0039B4238D
MPARAPRNEDGGIEPAGREEPAHSRRLAALHVTPRIFEFAGGRGTGFAADFDRFWRDVRTLSSHDPEVLARRTIGRHVLHDSPLFFPPHFKPEG